MYISLSGANAVCRFSALVKFLSIVVYVDGRDVHAVGSRIENFQILQNFPVLDPVLGC